jgi:hypothetical protein
MSAAVLEAPPHEDGDIEQMDPPSPRAPRPPWETSDWGRPLSPTSSRPGLNLGKNWSRMELGEIGERGELEKRMAHATNVHEQGSSEHRFQDFSFLTGVDVVEESPLDDAQQQQGPEECASPMYTVQYMGIHAGELGILSKKEVRAVAARACMQLRACMALHAAHVQAWGRRLEGGAHPGSRGCHQHAVCAIPTRAVL